MRTIPVFTLAACSAFAGAVAAQSPAAMSELDTDRDGSISRYEASAMPGLVNQFHQLDQNWDGALESYEFARFEAVDTGGDAGGAAGRTPSGAVTAPPAMTTMPPPSGATPPPSTITPAPGVSGTPPPPSAAGSSTRP